MCCCCIGALKGAKITKKYFESRSSKSKWGLSINMVDSVPIPKFKSDNSIHKRLAKLSEKAHLTRSQEDLKKIESEINKLSEKLLK